MKRELEDFAPGWLDAAAVFQKYIIILESDPTDHRILHWLKPTPQPLNEKAGEGKQAAQTRFIAVQSVKRNPRKAAAVCLFLWTMCGSGGGGVTC